MLALSIILEQIADSNESPLKRAVLSSGLAEDMEIYVSDGIAQPYLMMLFRGIRDGENERPDAAALENVARRLMSIVEETITKITDEGFSKRDLEASVNQTDFRFRQYPEPQALYRMIAAYSSWLYGGDPALYLSTDASIAKVRSMIDNGEIEDVAREILGDTSMLSTLILTPDTGFAAKEASEEAARVKAVVDALDDTGRESLDELNRKLVEWQQTEDSEEALSTIPQLDIADIDPMPQLIPTEEKDVCGAKVLFHQLPSNGIVHINAYFPITQLALSELPAAALITEFFKDLPTAKYDVLSLQNEIRMYIGGISFGLDILAKDNDYEECTPCLRVRASFLADKQPDAEALIAEILTETKFSEKQMMRELITQIDEDSKRTAMANGHRLGLFEARSHWSARDAAAEAVNGLSFMQYMHGMSAASDEELDAFTSFAEEVIRNSICRQNTIIGVTADSCPDLTGLLGKLPDGKAMPEKVHYESELPRRMGIDIPAAVSFAVTSYDLKRDGHKMNGSYQVASNIISLSHLWNNIRVQGGAYGASMSAGRTGSLFCHTYRDPSPGRSLGIFKTISDFLTDFASDESLDIDGFIISTIASTEPLLSPAAKGRSADDFYLSGFTDEDRIKIRKEILSTTSGDLAALSDVLSDMAEKGTVCVVGPKAALDACEDLEIFTL